MPVNIQYFRNLKVLDLSRNKLASVAATKTSLFVFDFPNLESLSLAFNKLTKIEDNLLKGAFSPKLKILDLSNNQVKFFLPRRKLIIFFSLRNCLTNFLRLIPT